MKSLSNTDAAYIAGLIDGEGSIGIYHNGQSLVGRLTITLTKPEALKWVQRKLGIGRIRGYKPKNKKHNKFYTLVVLSRQAKDVIEAVLSFLQVKRAQGQNLVRFQNRVGQRYGAKGIPREERFERQRLSRISKQLNKRGK